MNDEEREDLWRLEYERRAKEKWNEKYWSEIEDGVEQETPRAARPIESAEPKWVKTIRDFLKERGFYEAKATNKRTL